jgi:ribonucleotide reductase beta subunit family protein with ferritin-like domain
LINYYIKYKQYIIHQKMQQLSVNELSKLVADCRSRLKSLGELKSPNELKSPDELKLIDELNQYELQLENELAKLVADCRSRLTSLGELKSPDELKLIDELNQYELRLEKHEPILRENPQRFVLFPIYYPEVWKEYKKAQASNWTAEEITMADDLVQWKKGETINFSNNDKFFIKHVLAFFASFDGVVNENLANRFMGEVQIPEARCFYGFQIAIENVHGEVYSTMIDNFADDQADRDRLLHAVENYPSIKKLQNWALKWLSADLPFNQRVLAFACVEGILFSGPFCAIFWLKKRGLLPGLTFSNELISRDEGLHQDFACLLSSLLNHPATYAKVCEIVCEAVAIEKEFINESLPCNLIGMNATEMSQYIEYVADCLLNQLSCPKLWNSKNPFPWMELISLQNKTNFFEKRVGEYGKAKFSKAILDGKKTSSINILEDF